MLPLVIPFLMMYGIHKMIEDASSGKPCPPEPPKPPTPPPEPTLPRGTNILLHKKKEIRAGDKTIAFHHYDGESPTGTILDFDIEVFPDDAFGNIIHTSQDIVFPVCKHDPPIGWVHRASTKICGICSGTVCIACSRRLFDGNWYCVACVDQNGFGADKYRYIEHIQNDVRQIEEKKAANEKKLLENWKDR